MTVQEAIQARHSVRQYMDEPLSEDVVAALNSKIDEVNAESGLHIQLILNEPKSFQCAIAKYGHFSGVSNYLVMEKCGFIDTGKEVLCPSLEIGSDKPVKVMKLEYAL